MQEYGLKVPPRYVTQVKRKHGLVLNAADTRLRADLAPIIDGKTDLTKCTEIDLQKLDAELRMQRIVFDASGQVYDLMKSSWQNEGTKFALLGQVIRLVEEYLKSGAIVVNPPLFNTDPVRQRIIYMMNMNKIVQHLWSFIKLEQTEKIVPVFDTNKKVRSTGDMPTWFTSKPCFITRHSHISHCVFDSAWESTESYVIEKNPHVVAWAKNDHLGFEITYVFDGVVRKYLPDFLLRLDNGKILVLETKGQETRRDKEKRKALAEWVEAVNGLGEYGEWCNDVSYNVADVDGIIQKHIGVRLLDPLSVARLYVEKYDTQTQQLFLDFIDEKEFLYYKMRGDAALELSLEEGTPTILCFCAVAYTGDRTIEGMIIEIPFADLWKLPYQETQTDSDILNAIYEEGAGNIVLSALNRPRAVRSNEYVHFFTKWSGEPITLGKTNLPSQTIIYNVGQGSWSEIIDSNMNYTVFDCGTFIRASNKERTDLLRNNGYLVKASSAATSLVISHWDSDHYNLLRSVDNATLGKLSSVHFPDRCITLTSQDIATRLCRYCKKTEAISPPMKKGRMVHLHLQYQGSFYQMYIGSDSSSSNVSAITLQVHDDKKVVILTADQKCKHIFKYMLPSVSKYAVNIVVPHHGGDSGGLPIAPPGLKPKAAAVSTDGHSYGHPHSKVLNFFSSLGFKILRTDQLGRPIILLF